MKLLHYFVMYSWFYCDNINSSFTVIYLFFQVHLVYDLVYSESSCKPKQSKLFIIEYK